MSKILALDFGEKRIGLAISDDSQKIALPLKALDGLSRTQAIFEIKKICQKKKIKKIVVGLPLTLMGKEEDAATKTRQFAKQLKDETGLSIIFEDERLSSKEAEKILRKKQKRYAKEKVDVVSATLILEQYLSKNA